MVTSVKHAMLRHEVSDGRQFIVCAVAMDVATHLVLVLRDGTERDRRPLLHRLPMRHASLPRKTCAVP